jgi:vitamin B12 transporter
MRQNFLLATAILAALASAAAQAQDAVLQPTIEVTASRVAETVDATLADVSVITRKDIEASGAPDLIEVLRLQPGVDVARTGGAGQQTSVFLRGTNSTHVLVLIDGVRVASSNTGSFAFENLPIDSVERIEIVRGPRASYWGSDAIGGVIQIFTRKLDSAHLAASYGSYKSSDGSVGYGAQSDAGGFSVQLGARHVGGFSASNAAAGPYVYNPDDNGFQNHNIVAQGDYKFGTQVLSATIFRSEGTQSFDNGDPGYGTSRTLDQAAGINLQGAITDSWQERLSIGSSREDIATPVFGTDYHSTREQLAWTNDFTLTSTQHLIAGLDYIHDFGISNDTFGNATLYSASRNNTGVFAGWRVADGAFDSDLAVREDHDSTFGSAFSGSVAAGWKFNDDLRLSASYGTAFRAPNLNELYSPGYGGYYAGNPLLDPERSRSGEIALDWHLNAANQIDLRAFSTRVHDLIDFSGGTTFQAINVDHAAIDGAEIKHTWRNAGYSWSNSLTLQNPRDSDTGTQLLRRPKQKFSSVFEAPLSDKLHAGVELLYSGRSDDYGNVQLGSYTLVNLRANYDLSSELKLGLRLENLGDKNYQLVYGYNTPGRSGYLTLSWEPHF